MQVPRDALCTFAVRGAWRFLIFLSLWAASPSSQHGLSCWVALSCAAVPKASPCARGWEVAHAGTLRGCLGGSTRSGGEVTDAVVTNDADVAGSRMVGARW